VGRRFIMIDYLADWLIDQLTNCLIK
jgi:hypothetical protein